MLLQREDQVITTGSGRISIPDVELHEKVDVIALAIDMDGNILYFNKKAEEATGYSRDEVCQHSSYELLGPREYKKIIGQMTARSKDMQCQAGFTTTSRIITKHGRIRNIMWSYSLLYNEFGIPAGVLGLGHDITEKEAIIEVSKIAAQATSIDQMVSSFMDMVSSALNLKTMRLHIYGSDRCIRYIRTSVYPHGKAKRKAVRYSYRHESGPDEQYRQIDHYIPLQVDDITIGVLEVASYNDSRLDDHDLSFLRLTSNIISVNIPRISGALIPKTGDRTIYGDLSDDILDESSSGIAIIDAHDFKFIKVNESYLRQTGKRDIIGLSFEQAFPGALSSGIIGSFMEAISLGLPVVVKHVEHDDDKGKVSWAYSVVPMKGKDGDVSSIMLTIMDDDEGLTSLRTEACHSIECIKATISQISDGVAVCDADGNILIMNGAFPKVLRTCEKDLKGRNLFDCLKQMIAENASGKPLSRRQMALHRALRTGKYITGSRITIHTRSGSTRVLDTSASPIPDRNGNITRAVTVFSDVTVKMALFGISNLMVGTSNIDDLIEESIDLIKNAMEIKTLWFYEYDGNSGEYRLKLLKGELVNIPYMPVKEIPDTLNPDLLSRTHVEGRPILIKDYRRCASVRLFDPLAKKRAIRSIASVPLLAADKTIGIIIAATGDDRILNHSDLSDLLSLSRQMALSISKFISDREMINAKEKAELYVDILCHDICNVNRMIIELLQSALKRLYLTEDDRALMAGTLEAARSSMKVIEDVKKIHLAKPARHMRPVDIDSIIKECITSFRQAGDKEVSVTYKGRRGSYVYGTPLLKEVFQHVFDNAVTHSSGKVNINIELTDAELDECYYYRISIEDDGHGIPGDTRDMIFQRISSDEHTAYGRETGLFIVRMFTERFGGKIWVEDRAPGDYSKGYRFVILMPGYRASQL